jgi:hypothetical protein
MLAVLAAILRVVGRCLGFIIYVWGVAHCITADEVPQPTTIKTENKELQNYRKFPLQLSEVIYRLKWSHNECTIGLIAGLNLSHSECTIDPLADKISAGCDPDRHVATWSVLCMGLPQIQHCVSPFLQRCAGMCGWPCALHFKLDIVCRKATETGNMSLIAVDETRRHTVGCDTCLMHEC